MNPDAIHDAPDVLAQAEDGVGVGGAGALWLVSYDVPDDRRRNRVAKLLQGYGERVQYSVFECVLDDDQYATLRRRMARLVNEQEDSVRFYRLGPARHAATVVEVLGVGQVTERPVVYL